MDFDPAQLRRTTFAAVPEEKAFFVCRGDRVRTIRDLANCIESLTIEQFRHHVSLEQKRNDFSVWIHDVLKNPLLAHDVTYEANVRDKTQYVKTIRDHLAWLERA